MTEEELQEVEKQLSFPSGENGIEMANVMNETNIVMTQETLASLQLNPNENILELGHGNCRHLCDILDNCEDLNYTGLEISETMHSEAEKINQNFIENKTACFHLYDGNKIPFDDNSFDKIMTVNTLYFWNNPLELLNEIHRVTKPDGLFVIAFIKASYMKTLPFVKDRFTAYSNQDMKTLVEKSNYSLVEISDKQDSVKTKIGDFREREFSVAVLKK